MTKTEIVAFAQTNPGTKITHESFAPNEYLYATPYGVFYAEDGCLFENWIDDIHCGLRMRDGEEWETGWSLYKGDVVRLELTQGEFDMLSDNIEHMRCIIRDSNRFNFENFCSGECTVEGCDRPEFCNPRNWLRSKIVK
jgi:hypothetical protein